MARYRDAIDFVAWNDDTEFLNYEPCHISVTGSLIASLFNKTDEQVIADLRKAVEKREQELWKAKEDQERAAGHARL